VSFRALLSALETTERGGFGAATALLDGWSLSWMMARGSPLAPPLPRDPEHWALNRGRFAQSRAVLTAPRDPWLSMWKWDNERRKAESLAQLGRRLER
jgi:hypothetical protein